MQITVYVEAFNGFVLPIVLGFLLVLVNDKRVIGDRRNTLLGNAITFSLSAVIVVLGALDDDYDDSPPRQLAGAVYSKAQK